MCTRSRVAGWIAAALLVSACGRREPVPNAAASATATPTTSASSIASATEDASASPPPASSATWVEAVRLERWDEAARLLDALPDAEKSRPEVRYVRARVAFARDDHAGGLTLLAGLETALPLLAEDIARHRAEAKLRVGPYLEAAEYFAAKNDMASQLKAARAFEKANEPARARTACNRVLAHEKRTRAQEAEARALRLRLRDTPTAIAQADARWLAVQGADLSNTSNALATLAKVDPGHPLTAAELMVRSRTLADAGYTDEALRAIEEAAHAPGPKVTHLERLRAKGDVLYRARGRYAEAAKVLAECAAAGGPHAAEDAFHAARALSRADRDEEAIVAYTAVARRYPKTRWADEASYFVPYLHMLHGEWAQAARGFDAYLKKFPEGVERSEAARFRALTHLLAKEVKVARKLYERLSDDEKDPIASARMANMAALAALRDGDRAHAVARWTEVARMRPLSWPALVARARLEEAGAPLPPAIEESSPGTPPPPLTVSLPAPADMFHAVGLDADAEATLREREAFVTGGAAGRGVEALCATYGLLGRAKRRYQVAQQVPSHLLSTAPTPATQWAWDCVYPQPYEGHVRTLEATERLPEGLIYAVMRQESAYDPDAVSRARAVGLLQLLPETAKTLANDLRAPHEDARLTSPPYNLALGAHYLRQLLDRFHGHVPLAVAAYNAGPEAIARWVSRGHGLEIDTFVERIPYAETRGYVVRVMGNLARYAYLRAGEGAVPKVALSLKAAGKDGSLAKE